MSEIQIYSEDLNLILVVDGVRIVLNLNAAENLHLALGKAVPLLKEERLAALQAVTPLLNAIHRSQVIWDPIYVPQRNTSIELLSEGHVDAAFEALKLACGAEIAWAGFVDILYQQESGWFDLKAEHHSNNLLVYLSLLASKAPPGTDLAFLWSEHAWDRGLKIALSDRPSTSVPPELQERIWSWLFDLQEIPPGRFVMGSESKQAWPFESPCHEVQLTQKIHFSRYLVTQFIFENVMKENPSENLGALRPVENVSWLDCVQFCNQLSRIKGFEIVYSVDEDGTVHWDPTRKGFRLPTEAEWERAARGSQAFILAGSDEPKNVAWYGENAQGVTQGVGQKQPNGFGLYDMSGNVWEWCWDGYNPDFYSHPDAGWDPVGDLNCSEHVCRGGSYLDKANALRVSLRGRFDMETKWSALGFRVVLQEPFQVSEQNPAGGVLDDEIGESK